MNADKLTKQVIGKMLKENTGIHFLDSGGQFGRAWQKNQTREFDNEPESTLSVNYGYIEYTRNIYHFLCNALDYNKGLTNSLMHFESKREDRYESWYETIQAWIEYKGYKIVLHDNTYNSENTLSQDFVFYLVSKNRDGNNDLYDTDFVILMIHGGADIRGGYTSPKCFDVELDNFLMFAEGYIYCESDNEHRWYTDDAYNWYDDNNGCKLNDYKMVNLDEIKSELENNPEWQEAIQNEMSIDLSEQGLLFSRLPEWNDYKPDKIHPVKLPLEQDTIYYDDNKAYCPLCAARGILSQLLPG